MKKKIITIISIIVLIVLILALHYIDISQSRDLPVEETVQIEQKLEEKTTSQKIDELIQTITSSPKESSNMSDYISAHEQEFDEIVALDIEALKVLFTKFEEGTDGLEGLIIQKACSTILGGEDIKIAFTTGQEWYKEYKEHVFRIRDLNSNEFMQEHYPKSYILIELVEIENEYHSFLAKVTEMHEKYIVVEPLQDAQRILGNIVYVNISSLEREMGLVDEGTIVSIVYNGIILESYPPQIYARTVISTE